MASYKIRELKNIESVIIPIFDPYPLLTTKYLNYIKFKQAYNILKDPKFTKLERNILLLNLKSAKGCPKAAPLKGGSPTESYISPVWNKITLPLADAAFGRLRK